uniref:Interleukin-18 receptor 1 n=1 Tax=Leptobrachium leishanense TaxID=445787 RepID=A0A8C5MRG5_9ANUR
MIIIIYSNCILLHTPNICYLFFLPGNCREISGCAVEDEHYVLKCNLRNNTSIQNILANNEGNITWYKHTNSKSKVNISAEENSRIAVNGDTLEFWPLQLNDSGEYSCTNKSTNVYKCFFLHAERNRDISYNFFKILMTSSAIVSICIVFLVISCIILRIELVLLYRRMTRKDDTVGDGKEYDAYLLFVNSSLDDSEENEFAFKTLPNIMENHFGYKLCIFERDVSPGGAIADEIIRCLEKCRRLIILLSKNQISDKAMYELESGLHKAMVERKIKVVLIDFTLSKEMIVMPDSLQLLADRCRVKWEGEKSYSLKSRFWKKIQYLMPAKPFKHNISLSNTGNPLLTHSEMLSIV